MHRFNLNRLFKFLSIREKLLVAFILSALLPLVIGGFYALHFSSSTLKEALLGELTREVTGRASALEQTIKDVEGDLLFLTRLPTLRDYAEHMRPHGAYEDDEMRTSALEAFLNFAKYRTGIYQIRFLDEQGWERLRVDTIRGEAAMTPVDRLQNKSDRYYFQKSIQLKEDEIYISPMDLNQEFGKVEEPQKLVVRFATPLIDEEGERKGLVIINLFASDLLDWVRSLENRPGIKTFFVNSDGSYVFKTADGENEYASLYSNGNELERVPAAELFSGRSGKIEDKEHFLIYSPVFYRSQGGPFWVIALQYPKGLILSPLAIFIGGLVIIGVIIAGVELVLGRIAAGQFTGPILAIHREAEKIGRGDYNVRLEIETHDELQRLAEAVNAMAAKIRNLLEREKSWSRLLQEEVERTKRELEESMRRIYQMEKMASLGALSAGIAHEIGNPLGAIKTVIQAVDEQTTPGEQKIYLERIVSEIDRLSGFLRTFHSFVAPSEKQFVPCRLSEIAKNVILLVAKEAANQKVSIREMFSETPDIWGDPNQIQQVLLNLFVNAFSAMPEGGTLAVKIAAWGKDSSKASLSVTDTGHGIPQENLTRIFNPFFTTRPGGSGLGLAIVHKIVEEHGAEIHVKSELGKGSTFKIVFRGIEHA